MAQGKYLKLLSKKTRKGNKGYPLATIAYYGPTNKLASKIVCCIIKYEGAEVEQMETWFSDRDLRKSENVLGEMLAFIDINNAKTVSLINGIIG